MCCGKRVSLKSRTGLPQTPMLSSAANRVRASVKGGSALA